MRTAQTRLLEFHFPLQVHADDETATRLLSGDSRITSALLYQAADGVAINGVGQITPIFHGDELKREAPKRPVPHNWAGAILVWIAGFACGAVMLASFAPWA